MRNLTAKQKTLLKEQVDNNDIRNVEDLKYSDFKDIENINETEVFYQNANICIEEYRWSKI